MHPIAPGGGPPLERRVTPHFNAIDRPQDEEKGGISDRPDDEADVFHTFFGVAGLALLGHPGLAPVDPVYALPVSVVQRVLGARAGAGAAAAAAAATAAGPQTT